MWHYVREAKSLGKKKTLIEVLSKTLFKAQATFVRVFLRSMKCPFLLDFLSNDGHGHIYFSMF